MEWIVFATPEAATLRVNLQQAVDGLGLEAGRLSHALRSAAGWRAQQKAGAFRRKDAQDRLNDGGLSNARPAGHDQHLGCQRESDCRDLTFGKGETDTLFDPRQGLVGIDPRPWQRAICQSRQSLGGGAFRPMQSSKKYAGRFTNPVSDDRALLQLEVERGPDQLLRHFEQLFSQRHQLVCRE